MIIDIVLLKNSLDHICVAPLCRECNIGSIYIGIVNNVGLTILGFFVVIKIVKKNNTLPMDSKKAHKYDINKATVLGTPPLEWGQAISQHLSQKQFIQILIEIHTP